MFGQYDLRLLEDPKNVYGDAEDIHTILHSEALDALAPSLVAFIEAFYGTEKDNEELALEEKDLTRREFHNERFRV